MIDFNLWATSVGAYAIGPNSLEVRLRLSEETLDVLTRLLESVEVAVGTIVNKVHVSKLPKPKHDESTKPASTQQEGRSTVGLGNANYVDESLVIEPSPEDSMSEVFADVEALMDCLFDLGFLIKEAGRSSRLRRADLSFSKKSYLELEKHLEVLLQCEMDARWSSENKETTAFLLSTRLSPGQYNLIDANLRRRHRFTHARERFERNRSSGSASGEETSTRVDGQTASATFSQAKTREEDTARSSAAQAPRMDRKGMPKKVAFTASTIDPKKLKGKTTRTVTGESKGIGPKLVPTTPMTSITARVDYPKPPAITKNSTNRVFSCPCCYETLDVATAKSPNKWK